MHGRWSDSRRGSLLLPALAVGWSLAQGSIVVSSAQMSGDPAAEPSAVVNPDDSHARPSERTAGMTDTNDMGAQEVLGAEAPTDLFAALAGPEVRERVGRGIIRHDARGEFRRVSGLPEEAALALLELSDQAREYCRGVFAERRLALGVMLAEHLDEALAYGEAMEQRDRDLTTEFTTFFRDRWERSASPPTSASASGLQSSLAAVLSPEQYVDLERMLNEYWQAWVAWELRSRKTITEADCQRTRARLERTVFSEELRRAYDDQIKPYREKLEKLHEAVDPTAEQRTAIRSAVADFLRESRLRPTAEDRRALMRSLYRALDQERRAVFFELVAAETAGGTW